MKCPIRQRCPLFALFRMSASLRVWQEDYCVSVPAACARYQLAATGAPVPATLLPNGKDLDLPRLFPACAGRAA